VPERRLVRDGFVNFAASLASERRFAARVFTDPSHERCFPDTALP
jgi:hypothetical protein